jgi:sigma-B regulation protein RsbU (phosphoserine phosphatase)
MRTQQVLLVEDLLEQEPPLWTSDWLDREGFRAAAIAPLVADGRSIGALVIDSRRPRRFTEVEVRFLRLMANQAALAIEKARLHHEELQRQRIEEELAVGRKIQMSMLPAELPRLPGWEFAAHIVAARQVGGDFYDLFPLPGEPGRWGVVIADVSDKGVPAALFMALSRTTIRNIALRGRSPAEVLSWANRYIQEDSQSDMFLTAFYSELDTRNGWLKYANAGHNPPMLWRKSESSFYRLPASCPLLGVLQEVHVGVTDVQLAEGDLLVLYTDGISEAMNDRHEEFGADRLQETVRLLLMEQPEASAEVICAAIAEEVRLFAGGMVQYDDMTLLIIKRVEAVHDNE